MSRCTSALRRVLDESHDIDENVRASYGSLLHDPQHGIDRARHVWDAARRQLGTVIGKVAEAEHDIDPPVANRWRDT